MAPTEPFGRKRPKHIKISRVGGKEYHYDRLTNLPIVAEPGTDAYFEEIERGRAGRGKALKDEGTLGRFIYEYKETPQWSGKSPRTRSDYEKVFNYLKPLDAMPIAKIDKKFIIRMRNQAFDNGTGRGRRFCNYIVQVLSIVFNVCINDLGLAEANPADRIKDIQRPHGAPIANRVWTTDEKRVVFRRLAERNKNLLAAVAVGYYTGLRESDVITMLRRERKGGSIQTRAGKTGERIWIPEHPELQAILGPYLAQRDVEREVLPLKLGTEELILNRRREPYTTNGFQGSFFKIIRELEAEGAVDGGLTFHGLRTSCATAVAEAGCSAPQLMAVMGWKTLAMAEHYTRDAERRRLAGQALTMLLAAEDAVKPATS
jgi:integrase